MKQVIVVRDDIGMSRGKIAAQCCHASLGAALKATKGSLSKWQSEGQKKVVLKARNAAEIESLAAKCRKSKISFCVISDAGLTEIEPGTITAIGIGPEDDNKIDKISGSLPLLD